MSLPTSPIGFSSATYTLLSEPTFDLNNMHKRAEAFVEMRGLDFSDRHRLQTYIFQILEDSTFQADPQKYLKQWKEERELTQQYKFPEDLARLFFDQNFSGGCVVL